MRVRAGIVGGGSVNFGLGVLNTSIDAATTGIQRGYDTNKKSITEINK